MLAVSVRRFAGLALLLAGCGRTPLGEIEVSDGEAQGIDADSATCGELYAVCSTGVECCSGDCVDGACTGTWKECAIDGQPCSAKCCAGACDKYGKCGRSRPPTTCGVGGDPCSADGQCCAGTCNGGSCAYAPCYPGDPPAVLWRAEDFTKEPTPYHVHGERLYETDRWWMSVYGGPIHALGPPDTDWIYGAPLERGEWIYMTLDHPSGPCLTRRPRSGGPRQSVACAPEFAGMQAGGAFDDGDGVLWLVWHRDDPSTEWLFLRSADMDPRPTVTFKIRETVRGFSFTNRYIYIATDKEIRRVDRRDGSVTRLAAAENNITELLELDGWLYFHGARTLRRARIDGSGDETLLDFGDYLSEYPLRNPVGSFNGDSFYYHGEPPNPARVTDIRAVRLRDTPPRLRKVFFGPIYPHWLWALRADRHCVYVEHEEEPSRSDSPMRLYKVPNVLEGE